jgi:hypothetical protein
MDIMQILKRVPAWIIATALVAFLFVFIERIYIADQPFLIADMKFGPAEETGTSRDFPPGTIIAWDPTQRNSDGTVSGRSRAIPKGWVLCDGKRGTPILTDHVLHGVGTISNAGSAPRELLADHDEWGTERGRVESVKTYKVQFLCKPSAP